MKHSPGPWENREGTILADTREQVCCGRPCVGAEYMGQQEMVCCGNPDTDGDAEDPIATVKYEHDIPLVIAAPDMLAELRECEAALAHLLAGDPDLAPCLCGSTTLGNRLVHVRAAIAKAEGDL